MKIELMSFPPCGPEAPLASAIVCTTDDTFARKASATLSVVQERGGDVKDAVTPIHSGPCMKIKTEVIVDEFQETDHSDLYLSSIQDHNPIHENKIQEIKQEKDHGRFPFLVILTADQAQSIYFLRSVSTAEGPDAHLVAGKSSLVAEMYGVSPKTIRDIWNRKTWTQV